MDILKQVEFTSQHAKMYDIFDFLNKNTFFKNNLLLAQMISLWMNLMHVKQKLSTLYRHLLSSTRIIKRKKKVFKIKKNLIRISYLSSFSVDYAIREIDFLPS